MMTTMKGFSPSSTSSTSFFSFSTIPWFIAVFCSPLFHLSYPYHSLSHFQSIPNPFFDPSKSKLTPSSTYHFATAFTSPSPSFTSSFSSIHKYGHHHKRTPNARLERTIMTSTSKGDDEGKSATVKKAKVAKAKTTKVKATAKKAKKTPKAKTKAKATKAKTTRKRTKKQQDLVPDVAFVSEELLPEWMNKERIRVLTEPKGDQNSDSDSGSDSDSDSASSITTKHDNYNCVYYWMQRDMRTVDNWALLFAQHLAQKNSIPLHVMYVLPCAYTASNSPLETGSHSNSNSNLPPKVCEIPMTQRHATFLLGGLKVVEKELNEKNVPFHILQSKSHAQVGQTVCDFIMNENDSDNRKRDDSDDVQESNTKPIVVCDMNPLRQFRNWIEDQATPLMRQNDIPFYQVDAHNIVPVWFASPKREVGARTLRPKINKLLPEFMTHFPNFVGNDHIQTKKTSTKIDWEDCQTYLNCDDSVPTLSWAKPGRAAAMERFTEFCTSTTQGLKNFDSLRNDPNYHNVCSNLSPWVNHGMVSFQRLALEVRALKKYPNGTASYIEEGIVRRELSDNFVYYSKDNYDELSCAAAWAQETLQVHTEDTREYLYSLQELEMSKTHDDLWNAAQIQLVTEGTMHGFLRMYWAKKILEWTASPEIALRTGLYFNDRYALDGNDPNGFTGVGWSVMGIHDMGWKERPIFGKIRFMNYAGCKRKFKVDSFVAKYQGAKLNAMKYEAKQAKASISKMGKKRKAASR